METIHVNRTNQGNSWITAIEDVLTNVIVPKLSAYNNLTYIGMASFNNYREPVFQIGNNTNYYLRVTNSNVANNTTSFVFRITKTAALDGNGSILGANVPGAAGRISWGASYSTVEFYMRAISDLNNNLQVIWTPNPAYNGRTNSYPIVFAKSAKGRDVIIQSTAGAYAWNVFYLDDTNHVNYFIPQNTDLYGSATDLLKVNYLPIVTTGVNVTDAICDKMVRIYNNNLDAVYIASSTYNNDSAYVYKLARVGGNYYRQLVTNFWYEDPKGDEPVIDITT